MSNWPWVAVIVDTNLKVLIEEKVDFDADLPHHGTEKGVLQNKSDGEIFASVLMWLEAIDLLFERLKNAGLNFSEIDGVSGAGMQHGTIFWSKQAEQLLKTLDKDKPLANQLTDAFSHEFSPNWQVIGRGSFREWADSVFDRTKVQMPSARCLTKFWAVQ